ncbi:MAG TPA: hypothetical protein DCL77_01745 [Prolixibacteraceae bacterium]|jgi:hypothetical protein|nr:hypothetical protein [Prolixibacteraceae bacterium]
MKPLSDQERQEYADWHDAQFLKHFRFLLVAEMLLLEAIPLDDFTPENRKRYEELTKLLK